MTLPIEGILLALCVGCLAASDQAAGSGQTAAPETNESAVEVEAPVEAPVEFTEREIKRILKHWPLPPLPADPTNRWADDERAARFGQALFFDTRLSRNKDLSCASCHDPARGFGDGLSVAEGLGVGTRNSPPLWNLAYQRWFFWDGRADSMWAQAVQPIETEVELGGNRTALARTIADDDRLAAAYEDLFGELPPLADRERFPADARPVADDPGHPEQVAWASMTEADREAVTRVLVNAVKAIAAYERKLVSRDSPFDRFARGLAEDDPKLRAALSPSAQRGLKLFVTTAGCRQCHTGPNFTDDEFHDLGLAPREGGLRSDPGRHGGLERLLADELRASERFSDAPQGSAARELEFLARTQDTWGQFKTPSLRNVALTAPYSHDGAFERLEDVLRFYSTLEGSAPAGHHGERVLQPLDLSEREMADLVAFLASLTGDALDPELLAPPEPLLLDAHD